MLWIYEFVYSYEGTTMGLGLGTYIYYIYSNEAMFRI